MLVVCSIFNLKHTIRRGGFNNFDFNSARFDETKHNKLKSMNLNFGPQHPAAHGVLRLILQLDGEVITKTDTHVGLLHRGSEKLMEDRYYLKSLPYFDRFDYVSMMSQEHAYCLAIETAMGTVNVNSSITHVRTVFDELTRVLNHMLAVSCHALDVGSMSVLFWAFEEREKLLEFYERVSGARMHAAFYRPNEVNYSALSRTLLEDIVKFSKDCEITLNEIYNVLTYNKIWKQRLVNVGSYAYKVCLESGLTGVMARCVGIKRDLRLSKLESYATYPDVNFRGYIGNHGDSYDRYLIRMYEMAESLFIVTQVIDKCNTSFLPKAKSNVYDIMDYVNGSSTERDAFSGNTLMEKTIKDFKYWSENIFIQSNVVTKTIEAPKGEFGVSLVSDGSNYPHRIKVRSPAYHHLQLCPRVVKGHFLADLVALIGTIDIVFGEIDR